MDTIREYIENAMENGVYKLVLSGAKNGAEYRKVTVTRLDNEYFIEKLTEKQAFHAHIALESAAKELESLFSGFSQINAWNESFEFTARLSKKGRLLTGRHACSKVPTRAEGQNRAKTYLLEEKRIVPPLVDMGVMTPSGEIKKAMYDKFKQINRFLEFIDEIIKDHSLETLNIIDFGCGKSYLTFIVYYYFTEIRHMRINMTGVDLKADVIEFCSSLSEKYGYSNLKFVMGDIANFRDGEPIDMVISLHACDTATDYAIYNAIKRNAKFILSVPCCQHELAKSADLSAMPVFDDDGILRERVSALLTDGLRGQLITACGYKTRLMEFVDLSHTPKNLLIRARKTTLPDETRLRALETAESTLNLLGTEQTLHRLLKSDGII